MLKSENCFPCKEVFEEEVTLAGVIPSALFCAGLSTLRAMGFVLGGLGSEERQFRDIPLEMLTAITFSP